MSGGPNGNLPASKELDLSIDAGVSVERPANEQASYPKPGGDRFFPNRLQCDLVIVEATNLYQLGASCFRRWATAVTCGWRRLDRVARNRVFVGGSVG